MTPSPSPAPLPTPLHIQTFAQAVSNLVTFQWCIEWKKSEQRQFMIANGSYQTMSS